MVANLVFRSANEDDLPTLAEKYNLLNENYYNFGYLLPHPENVGESWVDSFKRTLGRFSQVYVAEKDGQIVGFALCRLKRLPAHMGGVIVGELSDIWVSPEIRRSGIGASLTRLVLDWLRQQGAHSVEVQVLRDNETAWKLFSGMGFNYEYRSARLIFPGKSANSTDSPSSPVAGTTQEIY
jgi:ribosomal protein S18 acetylase RimI-like enzyme